MKIGSGARSRERPRLGAAVAGVAGDAAVAGVLAGSNESLSFQEVLDLCHDLVIAIRGIEEALIAIFPEYELTLAA